MKTTFIRLFDKVIFKVLTLLGCVGLFAACYGPVEADYEVIGTVTDVDTDAPIEGIQISLKKGKYPLDTIYTDEAGAFRIYGGFLDSLQVKAEDIDGKLHGGPYLPDSTLVHYYLENDEREWEYIRHKTVNFQLTKQEETEE